MSQPFVREHKHVIIRAWVSNPPREKEPLISWCREVIEAVGMKCIGGPLCVYSDMEGNKGHTAIAVLDFSHLSIHVWDEIDPSLIEFDIFSCKDFNTNLVLDKLNEFGILNYSLVVVNRDELDKSLTRMTTWKNKTK